MASFSLKAYQAQAIDALTLFLRQASTMGLEPAWAHAMTRQKMPQVPYHADELGAVPCVCLRVPTGGGKTLMASHAIVRIAQTWADTGAPLALWLTPSDMIRSQTLNALRTPGHPYTQALRDAYGDALHVIGLDELANIAPDQFGSAAIVVVATIQTFRVEKKSDRRAYRFSEAFEPHFRKFALTPAKASELGLSAVTQEDLDDPDQTFLTTRDLGRVKTSAANLLALMRPIVIVDEAHNAKTPKSLEMLRNIRPSAVLDLTATPVPKKTNVLYSVSARELEAEEMIKLPILLAEHTPDLWADAVRDAVLRRHALEAEAAHELDYIRPIILFQAQDKGDAITPQVLKQHLIEIEKVAEYEIAVATGTQRELDEVNLFDPKCQIRYVITVDALREGWDCSFAYVLCSLQNLRSNTAVEQLLGRVLRMPYAKKRKSHALNRAYAQVIAKSFTDAAGAMVDKLVSGMGFNALDVPSVILPDPGGLFDELSGGNPPAPKAPTITLEVPASAAPALAMLPDIEVTHTAAGPAVLTIQGEVSEAVRDAILNALPAAQRAETAATIAQQNAMVHAQRAPAERGERFAPVPLLCLNFQNELQLLDSAVIDEVVGFDLLLADPQPRLTGFDLIQSGESIEIYLEGERVRFGAVREAQLSLDLVPTQTTEASLIAGLVAHVRQPEVTPTQMHTYVGKIVAHLTKEKGLTLTGLLRAQFQLGQAILSHLEAVKSSARKAGFQQLMLDNLGGKLACDPNWTFEFRPGRYPTRAIYSGAWVFRKHYYNVIDTLKASGEEFECAKLIDLHPRVKHWARNLVQQPDFAFWLQTSTDRFYPDFVVELVDGTIAVIEYKGEDYATNDDSREKRGIGERWAQVTQKRFAMIEKSLNGANVQAQLNAAFS